MKHTILTFLLLIPAAQIPLPAQNRACRLLSTAEVKSATGIAYAAPQEETTPRGDVTCVYSNGPAQRFSVAIHERGGKALYERNKAVASKRMTVTPVSGIGDDAYLAVVGAVNQFSFLKGDTAVLLTIFGQPGAGPLQDLARKAAGRL